MTSSYVFTSESVTEGHPDKLCDQISDALVDQYLYQDRLSRVTAECAVSTGIVFVAVKAASEAMVDVPHTVREVILKVGYNRGNFNGYTCTILTNINALPRLESRLDEMLLDDEALNRLTAQDNVTVFGYACTHTPALLPLPIWLAHRLVRQLDKARHSGLDYLTPDGKCQVAVVFEDHTPRRIHSITLIATQYTKKPFLEGLQRDLLELVIQPVFAEEEVRPDEHTLIRINPEGVVEEGGPLLHTGLTGRKHSIDTYGGFTRQGSAALSGKDPLRVDRTGAYAARYAAKNIVAAGLATHCEVQISYAIGLARPISLRVETFGTGRLPDDELARRLMNWFDFRPGGIVRRFGLRDVVARCGGNFYRRLAVYGQIGRLDLAVPWEDVSQADALRE
ncbi:MAG: methionine adenosyltransferase [Anaerolineae bacterium]|nr:methionine adenosyltransferase [Anaerolineae bacterium]MDW8099514.1 methionine adenosyltransferase [Anaerolineae bacterium]